MYRLFLLLFSAVVFSSMAQPDSGNRCAFRRMEDPGRFEHWLYSKQTGSARKLDATIYRIPVVVHVLHLGEPVGEGFNYAEERIRSQIRTLNEDFRRQEGTPGFNVHPDGGDARIEFILAKFDPDGNETDGIVRVDMNSVDLPPSTGDVVQRCSEYSYWDPEQYLNIWCMATGLPPGLFLGSARFPASDLDGLPQEMPAEAGDGVFINALNFGYGETNNDPDFNMGRTLTHEIGHFLGLLHIWGNCGQYSDYCDDTPEIGSATVGCPSTKPMTCDGSVAMIENYMDLSHDRCMNIFTHDQIARMRTVLENSPRRKSLLTSPALDVPTGTSDDITHALEVYPNPATDKIYIAAGEKMRGHDIQVVAHTLLGKPLFKKSLTLMEAKTELLIQDTHEKMIVLTIKGAQILTFRKLIIIE